MHALTADDSLRGFLPRLPKSMRLTAGDHLIMMACRRHAHLFDHEIRKEGLDDFSAGWASSFRRTECDELIPAFKALPKLLHLMRIETLIPLKIDQS
ncbi:hypothetical protein Nwi_1033 [Nitrobacter winogradskyi Nb-255]|uniref:Uncharacterized protein n=1 Tax=Nitrobacter winogradskyi (strain ATCC 25391 / DSM 10237 / CIP 104748 / NCIMB 11846 / Nb-255) TaxID=323098 RepID=Q3STU6_NITWN|nr:hypothetical protein Nwi_1033 [Nitrobacter winogradskyi Nb-255]